MPDGPVDAVRRRRARDEHYRVAARWIYATEEICIDDDARVAPDGAGEACWVQAWVRVPKEEAEHAA